MVPIETASIFCHLPGKGSRYKSFFFSFLAPFFILLLVMQLVLAGGAGAGAHVVRAAGGIAKAVAVNVSVTYHVSNKEVNALPGRICHTTRALWAEI